MSDQIEIEEYDCEIRLLTEEEQRQMEALDAKRRKAVIPLYEVAPIRHGRWLYKPEMYDESTWECSECGEPYTLIDGAPVDNLYFYCPNCGARMDGEQDEQP